MATEPTCPRCGMSLPAGFPEGICPTCLIQQGLSPSTIHRSGSSPGGSGRRHSWTPPSPAEIAPRFPQLEVVELLGQGGMGAVYKVRQRDLDRWAALKILPDDVAHDPSFAERFQREARALALLGHQHIVIVYEFGQRDGVYFLLMEYIDGVNLRQAIRGGQVLAKDALSIVAQICDALQFAHEEGVVHRDIKPENILIDRRGRVKIADFGLAKMLGRSFEVPTLTGTHQVMGTPVYMAPEQMEGTRGVDHRADIFSLGVVFYELLTGELPLGRFAPPSQKYQLDVRLDEVVLRTLEKEPDRRYQQASEVKNDVESIRNPAAPSPVASKPGLNPRDRKRGPGRSAFRGILRVLIGMAALGMITFAMLIVFYFARSSSPNHAATLLEQERWARRDAEMRYQETVRRQQAEQAAQQALVTEEDDSEEAQLPVQFKNGIPKLNAKFGEGVLIAEQRFKVNQILEKIHARYLLAEQQHTQRQESPKGIEVEVTPLGDEAVVLENELWTAIDAEVPVGVQKWLRSNLPLFADTTQPLPRTEIPEGTGGMPMMGGGGMSSGASMGGMAAMGPSSGMMASSYYPATQGTRQVSGSFPHNIRYCQVLGWKLGPFPLRIQLSRRGSWYRWNVEAITSPEAPGSNIAASHQLIDQGEAPRLPSGLQRFWVAQGRPSAMDSSPFVELSGAIKRTTEAPTPGFEVLATDDAFAPEKIRDPDPLAFPGHVDPGTNGVKARPAEPSPVGPLGPFLGDPGSNNLKSVQPFQGELDPGEPHPPKSRPAKIPEEPLTDQLLNLERMQAGESTPWPQVDRQIEDLLARHPADSERGMIHLRAGRIYAQGDIRGHAAQVTRHSIAALKLIRDPLERAKLYLDLGCATEVRDTIPEHFLANRADATRWYLKGYKQLLAFDLPNRLPELPIVEKTTQIPPPGDSDESGSEQLDGEVRHAALLKRREETQFIRELMGVRQAYVDRMRELFGRLHQLYDSDADPQDRLRQLATDLLKDPVETKRLLRQVWPDEPETAH